MGKITNAVRIVEQAGIDCETVEYDTGGNFENGVVAAHKAGIPEEATYKTLVTEGHSKEHYVFVIPVACELDRKKAASSVGEKKIEMIPHKNLTAVTGYIKGACSPVGMKKQFKTVIDESAEALDKIYVSGGKRGLSMGIAPKDLAKLINASFYNVTI